MNILALLKYNKDGTRVFGASVFVHNEGGLSDAVHRLLEIPVAKLKNGLQFHKFLDWTLMWNNFSSKPIDQVHGNARNPVPNLQAFVSERCGQTGKGVHRLPQLIAGSNIRSRILGSSLQTGVRRHRFFSIIKNAHQLV